MWIGPLARESSATRPLSDSHSTPHPPPERTSGPSVPLQQSSSSLLAIPLCRPRPGRLREACPQGLGRAFPSKLGRALSIAVHRSPTPNSLSKKNGTGLKNAPSGMVRSTRSSCVTPELSFTSLSSLLAECALREARGPPAAIASRLPSFSSPRGENTPLSKAPAQVPGLPVIDTARVPAPSPAPRISHNSHGERNALISLARVKVSA